VGIEQTWHDEVKECPQFLGQSERSRTETQRRLTLHVVLYWRTSQEEAIAAMESKKRLPPNAGRVLDVLSFVKNHILPFDPLEILLILGDLQTAHLDTGSLYNARH
jgi:hypothetical protein